MITYITRGDTGNRLQAIVIGVLLLSAAAALLVGLDMLLVQGFSRAMIAP